MIDKESLLKETYARLMEVGFGESPLEEIPNLIDENVMSFGTALDEKILSLDDFRELIIDQRNQSINFDEFNFISNPVITRLLNDGNTAFIVDEIELKTRIGDEVNKLSLRMSTIFEYKNDSWKLVHSHGSTAEHISGGKDPWHVEEWKKKTAKLQKMVEEKTVELVQKNNELEIEASLERVRAVAMGMQKSEDLLSICEVSYHEFEKLGFENLRAVLIHILNDQKRTFIDYDYCNILGGKISNLNYDSHPAVLEFFNQITSADDAFAEAVLSGEELESFKKVRVETGQKDDPRLYDAHALYYYGYSIGVGDFTISTLKPIDGSQRIILKKFRNVFDLAYKRYNDISNAEARAREARIEAALERVRAKAMAMNSTEHLTHTADTFFSELLNLNISPHRCGFGIVDGETRIADIHATSATQDKSIKIITGKLKLHGHPVLDKIFEGYEKQKEYHPVLKGKEISEYYAVMNPQVEFPNFPDDEIQYGYYFYFREGGVFAWTDREFTEDELEIFRRYRSVLSLTYRRYIDLKEAEAQAREARIELSLERIRAQVTAMRESSELLDIVVTMRSEFVSLGLDAHYFWQMRYLPEKYEKAMTSGDGARIGMIMTLPRHIHGDIPLLADWEKSDKPTVVYAMDVNEALEYVDKMINLGDFKQVDPNAPTHDDIRRIGGLTFVMARTTHGEIGYSLPGIVHDPPAEDLSTLARFAGVFDLAYRRFEDLKEAEAQAREAKIEAALERVRSRTMGMQKSDELQEVIQVIYDQFIQLNINVEHTGFIIDYKDRQDMLIWLADMNGAPSQISIPYFDSPHWNSFLQAKKDGKDFFTNQLNFEEKNKFYKQLFTFIPELPAEARDFYFSCPGLAISTALLENVGLYIENFSGNPYLDEENKILMRFGKVFQQTYTRFLDLQKAEKQAREARIEASLERVRGRTMAMQKSEELAETAVLLFKQFAELVRLPESSRSYISIIDAKEKGAEVWMTLSDGEFRAGSHYVNFSDDPLVQKVYKAWKNNDPYVVRDLEGEDLNKFISYLSTFGHVKSDEGLQRIVNNPPRRLVYTDAVFKQGLLGILTFVHLDEDALGILTRFAKVFEQTYTRFLDLENAERQNKIIQAENERKTKELEEARNLQLAMLPNQLPQLSKLDIAVYMKTATEVGGDYYDFSIKDDGSLNICLGDATGHGLKAGTLVAMMKSLFVNDSVKLDISKFFHSSNETLKKMSLNKMMMAFAMINIYGHKIKISNAGIPPIFIFRKDKQMVEEVNLSGLPIGAMRGAKYEVWQNELSNGDTVLMLSDGMPELQNPDNQMYGYDKLKDAFLTHAGKNSNEIISALIEESRIWSAGREQDDDITFVVLKMK